MNREEAIKEIKKEYYDNAITDGLIRTNQAFDMAIKALENQGCGCGLCLAHNNMICPILKEEKNV